MAVETEHKYLVKKDLWPAVRPKHGELIKQAYIFNSPEKSLRVRLKGKKAYLALKGKTEGASRHEYEYEIPYEDGEEMISKFASKVMEKTRYIVVHDHHTWEVDEFHHENEGLVIAEIEIKPDEPAYPLPPWVDKEVTTDTRFYNANLFDRPYTTW